MWIATNDKCPCVGEGKERWAQSKQCTGHPWPVQLLVFYSGFLHSGCLWKLWSKETYTMVGRYRLEVDHCNLHGLCIVVLEKKNPEGDDVTLYTRDPKRTKWKIKKNHRYVVVMFSRYTKGRIAPCFLAGIPKTLFRINCHCNSKSGCHPLLVSLFACLQLLVDAPFWLILSHQRRGEATAVFRTTTVKYRLDHENAIFHVYYWQPRWAESCRAHACTTSS